MNRPTNFLWFTFYSYLKFENNSLYTFNVFNPFVILYEYPNV